MFDKLNKGTSDTRRQKSQPVSNFFLPLAYQESKYSLLDSVFRKANVSPVFLGNSFSLFQGRIVSLGKFSGLKLFVHEESTHLNPLPCPWGIHLHIIPAEDSWKFLAIQKELKETSD